MGPSILVIKKGEHGALLFTDDGVFATPAFPTGEVHDPTGAGDAFLGAFCGQLAREPVLDPAAMRRAVIFATVMASFTVESIGPMRLQSLTPGEVNGRIAALYQLAVWPQDTARLEC